MANSVAKIQANARYDAKNTIQKKLKFNKNTDVDILEHLETIDNFQGYIKTLIRADIENKK